MVWVILDVSQCHCKLSSSQVAILNSDLYISKWMEIWPSGKLPFDSQKIAKNLKKKLKKLPKIVILKKLPKFSFFQKKLPMAIYRRVRFGPVVFPACLQSLWQKVDLTRYHDVLGHSPPPSPAPPATTSSLLPRSRFSVLWEANRKWHHWCTFYHII